MDANINIGRTPGMPQERTPMTEKIECLTSQGYTDEFMITEEGLKSIDTGEVFQPNDVVILEHYRYEGISDPDDMAIMYVVETTTGLKGTVVDAFGIYGNRDLMEFMNMVKDNTIDSMSNADIKECFKE